MTQGDRDIISKLDEIKAALTSGDAGDATAANQAAANTKLDSIIANTASTPASENHLGEVGGNTKEVAASFTRPGDTNAYAISDAVSDSTSAPTVITFTAVGRVNAGSGYITTARLVKNGATTTNANFRLYLYSVAPTPVNDNAAFPLLWANRTGRIGYIDFSSMSTEGAGSDSAQALATATALEFVCASGTTNLFGVLVAKAAYAPASAEQFHITLGVDRN